MSSRSVQEPPLPWRPFLEELDEALSEGVELHCIGGVQYVRAQAGFEVTTEASDFECGNMTHWGRIHRKYEMWLKDPDDVFLDAEERNEQRKKQGLPPRIIIMPCCRRKPLLRPKRWHSQASVLSSSAAKA